VRSTAWEKAQNEAFDGAVKEFLPEFIQCSRCSSWVCRKKCWNNERGLCKGCAPDLAVEASAAPASRTVEEIWAHSKMAEEDRQMLQDKSWRERMVAFCAICEAFLVKNVKFCPECGAKIASPAHCTECGNKLPAGAKFCEECGAKA
jgi:membrane protease subunit (stomatin/prohibitin family)